MSKFNPTSQELLERLKPEFLQVELVTEQPTLTQIKCGRDVHGVWGKDYCVVNMEMGATQSSRMISPWSVSWVETNQFDRQAAMTATYFSESRKRLAYTKTLWGLILLIKKKHPEYCRGA